MTFNIITLGCKVNTYESNFIHEQLLNNNWSFDKSTPDIIVINSCLITNTAEAKSKKVINRAIRENPHAIIALIGCYSESHFNDLKRIPSIKVLLGNIGKSNIVTYLNKYLATKEETKYLEDLNSACFEDMMITDFKGRTRAFVKIQDGCNSYCSYCIIPYVRGGKIRSKKLAQVIKEINVLVEKGYKEVVLTGIHTGKYHDGDHNLLDLLKAILGETKLVRCRISSIEINELTNEVTQALKHERFARHLHIPLQAGTDLVLEKMNRCYNTQYFKDKLRIIREAIPSIAITTDLIVGHPYESEQLFNQAIDLVKELKFAGIHVFPYATRDNTPSATMDQQVSEIDKKKRVRAVLNVSNQLTNDYAEQFQNQILAVLVEKQVSAGLYFGHSSEYLPVYIKSTDDITKKMINVKITKTNSRVTGVPYD